MAEGSDNTPDKILNELATIISKDTQAIDNAYKIYLSLDLPDDKWWDLKNLHNKTWNLYRGIFALYFSISNASNSSKLNKLIQTLEHEGLVSAADCIRRKVLPLCEEVLEIHKIPKLKDLRTNEDLTHTDLGGIKWFKKHVNDENTDEHFFEDKYVTKGINKYAILVVNSEFEQSSLANIKAVENDCEKIEAMLEDDGFHTMKILNQNAVTIVETIKACLAKTKTIEILFLGIFSHGTNETIYAKNDSYKLEDIIDWMAKSRNLLGVPKVVFIEACRGNKINCGVQPLGTYDKGHVELHQSQYIAGMLANNNTLKPTHHDFCILYGSWDGYIAFATVFTDKFVNLVSRYGKDKELIEIFKVLTAKFIDIKIPNEEHLEFFFQTPCFVSSLTKKLFLLSK